MNVGSTCSLLGTVPGGQVPLECLADHAQGGPRFTDVGGAYGMNVGCVSHSAATGSFASDTLGRSLQGGIDGFPIHAG